VGYGIESLVRESGLGSVLLTDAGLDAAPVVGTSPTATHETCAYGMGVQPWWPGGVLVAHLEHRGEGGVQLAWDLRA
jgi:hypothetical protein